MKSRRGRSTVNYVSRDPAEHVQISHAGRPQVDARTTNYPSYAAKRLMNSRVRFVSGFFNVVLHHMSERALTPHGPPAMVTPRADFEARGKIKISGGGGNVRLNDAINIRYLLCRAEFGCRGRKRQNCHFFVNFARLPRIPPTSWSLSVSSRDILIDRVGGEGPRREEGRGANSPLGFLQDKILVVSICSSLSFLSPCLYALMHFKMPFRCSFVCCPEVFFISAALQYM